MARISPPTATPPGRTDILTALVVGPDSPLNPDLDLLFARHQAHCHADTPPESIHMMDRSALNIPAISFLALRDGENAIAMGAVKDLGDGTAELKSMHVLTEARGKGAAQLMLSALVQAARDRGARAIYLETGAQPSFAAARALYLRAGFAPCPPFAQYREDPNSAFMVLDLRA